MNNRFIKTVSLILAFAALLAVITLSSCGTKLVRKNGEFYCAQNGVTYKEVNYQYLAVSISKEKYAELDENGTKSDLFTLENVDPEKWLATADGRLFCDKNEKVPSIEEMEIDSVLICNEGSNLTVSLAEISSEESVNAVLDCIKNGSELEYPVVGEAEEMLSLRMSSEKYPWLYYCFAYIEFIEDVVVKDYPEDIRTYVYREVDESVKVTTVSEYECWYLVNNSDERDVLVEIAKNAEIPYGTVTKPDPVYGTLEYVGFYFSEFESLEECINSVVEKYTGNLSDNKLHTLLDYPDIDEKIHIVEYNYGKYLIQDKATGKCVKAIELIHEYKEQIKHD